MSKRRRIVLGGSVALLILTVAGMSLANQRERGPLVRTEAVTTRDLVASVTASGYVQPKRKVDISADISGRVTDVHSDPDEILARSDVSPIVGTLFTSYSTPTSQDVQETPDRTGRQRRPSDSHLRRHVAR